MRALITGSAGFVGRHFDKFLTGLGWTVWRVDTAHSDDAIDFFHNEDYNYTIFDLVIHCAYHVGGRATIDGKNLNLADNLILDSELFNWAIRSQQRAVIYFSSSAAYPTYYQTKATHKALREDDLNLAICSPDANYGWAKVTGERLAEAASSLGLRVHVVRPFSGYGSDQSLDYPFPSIIRRVKNNDLSVWGPRGQSRDWIHIDDVVAGSFQVYQDDDRRPVNLCTGIPTEMGELALMVKGYTSPGREPSKVVYDISKPTGVFYRVGDPTRMLEHHTPKISLDEGIRLALG